MPSAKPNVAVLALIDDVKTAALLDSPHNPSAHAKLLDTIHKLNIAAETPLESILRVQFQLQQNVAIRVALEMGILEALVQDGQSSMGAACLAERCGGEPSLIIRIMRLLAAMSFCDEVAPETYASNCITRALNVPEWKAGVQYGFDTAIPVASKVIPYLQQNNFQDPTNCNSTASTFAFGMPIFQWLAQNPSVQANFNLWMDGRRKGKANWLDIFPFEDRIVIDTKKDNGTVLFVDVGGNEGHVVKELRARYPDLDGRVILQDQQSVVNRLLDRLADFEEQGIEVMAHDFFNPQPVKGARTYFLRAILHNWSDPQCVQVLTHIASSMVKGYSKLIINDYVLPATGAGLLSVQQDLLMMTLFGGVERTEGQWHELLEKAGLRIERIWMRDGESGSGGESEGVIEAVLREE
ncbi:MAG: hypothetical protein MMC33_002895 [Icmadophila ericetorum]|nr:hypothetical protein [Icmadophila ericetorum]